jgi:glucose/arabinose dehydrogenase
VLTYVDMALFSARKPSKLSFLLGVAGALSVGSFLLFACSGGGTVTPPATDGGTLPDGNAAKDAAPEDLPDTSPCESCKKFCELPGEDTPLIQVPPEFCVRDYYAPKVIESRVMRFAPNGDLLIAAPAAGTPGGAAGGPGAILVLPDDDGDGVAEAPVTYAGGTGAKSGCSNPTGDPNDLTCVHGLLITGGYVYFTLAEEVRRYKYTPGDRKASGESELVAKLEDPTLTDPAKRQLRWTHTLDVTRDGVIYVSRGRFESSGQCTSEQLKLGAVFALHVENNAPLPVTPEVVADGFRNPMYMRVSKRSGELYAAELSGDGWLGIGGKEKLALIKPGEKWGYPCCVAKNKPLVEINRDICSDISEELIALPLSNTPFGFDFEPGNFPAPYNKGMFVALHGAFGGKWEGTALGWAPTDEKGRPTGQVTQFATGWSTNFPGRATDVAFAPDGRLFVVDDTDGRIFWIAPRTLPIRPKK